MTACFDECVAWIFTSGEIDAETTLFQLFSPLAPMVIRPITQPKSIGRHPVARFGGDNLRLGPLLRFEVEIYFDEAIIETSEWPVEVVAVAELMGRIHFVS
jgi:hypothetical protein